MTRLVWDHYWKAASGKCCSSSCEHCPYEPKWKGGSLHDKTTKIQPWILEQLNSFSVENAPNAEFSRYPDCDERVIRLKHWSPLTRPQNIQKAKKEDFYMYFGYYD
ncbi:MAG: hypothetical protein ACMXYA_02745 [Candidatus Woesearchaeota archaeon]